MSREAAVKISAVSSSFASSMALRTSFGDGIAVGQLFQVVPDAMDIQRIAFQRLLLLMT